ncbi:hypothetical protein TRIP_B330525 [uncultured Desulfatiglans sp.]|nr:hypothetical protein TRIP_B330525 [uncultured Desulfatiglans sp.]
MNHGMGHRLKQYHVILKLQIRSFNMVKNLLFVVAILSLCNACASKTPFVYNPPPIGANRSGSLSISLDRLDDRRQGDTDIDAIFEQHPVEEIDRIIEHEMISTGLFSSVVRPDSRAEGETGFMESNETDLHADLDLLMLQWECPDGDEIAATTVVLSALTGVVGGLIYACTETYVIGTAHMDLKLTDVKTGDLLFEKTYIADYNHPCSKIKFDHPTTKAEAIGGSVQVLMQEFKADLNSLLGGKAFQSAGISRTCE